MRRNITWKIWQISGYGFGGYPLDCERAPYESMRSAGAITSENQLEIAPTGARPNRCSRRRRSNSLPPRNSFGSSRNLWGRNAWRTPKNVCVRNYHSHSHISHSLSRSQIFELKKDCSQSRYLSDICKIIKNIVNQQREPISFTIITSSHIRLAQKISVPRLLVFVVSKKIEPFALYHFRQSFLEKLAWEMEKKIRHFHCRLYHRATIAPDHSAHKKT